jgi:predicted N-acetyltransferase YhbS
LTAGVQTVITQGMQGLDFIVTHQKPKDAEAVERLHARAFGPGRFARTAFRIREQAGKTEDLAFVAHVGSLLVGAVQLTPIRIGESQAFMLGPLTVDPAFEGRGIGRILLERCAHSAHALGSTLIVLVGDESYYKRNGYKRVPMGQITLPGPVDPMRILALELEPDALKFMRGEVRGGT